MPARRFSQFLLHFLNVILTASLCRSRHRLLNLPDKQRATQRWQSIGRSVGLVLIGQPGKKTRYIIKEEKIGRTAHMERMTKIHNFGRKPEGKKPSRIPRHRGNNAFKMQLEELKLTKLRGLSPHANYTYRAAAAGRRS